MCLGAGTRAAGDRRAVLSPLNLDRENPTLIGGDSLSGSHHLDQNFLSPPVFGCSRYQTGCAISM
jgi:phytoene dehydrogenase-like protein